MFKIINQIAIKNKNLNFKNLSSVYKSRDVILYNSNLKRLQSSNSQNTDTGSKAPSNKPSTASYSKSSSGDQSSFRKLLVVFTSGAFAYLAISYYLENRQINNKKNTINYTSKNLPGKIIPTKSLNREKNPGNIKITLYQYVTCPFCCKVRAYLDYYGYTYDIVEVNSITKAQLDWSGYKKVPTLAIQIPSKEHPEQYEENIIQLNDSSVIISAFETFRIDPNTSLSQIKNYYEPLEFDSKDKSKSNEFMNKYFVMLHNDNLTDGKDVNERKDEREWRKWVDSKFVHVISPNVYRTMNEALAAFNWFDQVGNWKDHFSSFERASVKYLGSLVMYFIGKSLKKKHNLKENVRISLYELCEEWVNSLNSTFMGGSRPNLADLALYGVMGSFEGCEAFNDMMNNTKIKHWYESCKDQVDNSKGSFYLNNPVQKTSSMQEIKIETQPVKKTKRFIIF